MKPNTPKEPNEISKEFKEIRNDKKYYKTNYRRHKTVTREALGYARLLKKILKMI